MILSAGGAGYIESHANKILNKRVYETVVYDNLSRGHRKFVQWGHFVQGNLADKDFLRLCFRTYPIEVVMHYGAFCYVGESVGVAPSAGSCQEATVKKLFAKKNLIVEVNFTNPVDKEKLV
jgi:UDP-glucose 4-epimerase